MMHTSRGFRVMQYFFAGCVTFFTLAPFFWLFISSISYRKDLTTKNLHWIPSEVTFQRYADIFTNPNNDIAYAFRLALWNSLQVAVIVTIVATIVGGLAAYAFSRLRFRFRKPLIYMFLFTYMVPPVVIVIPLYIIISKLHMLDSKLTLIALNLTFIIPFVIWVMQNYFSSIDKGFEEAAVMDGCSRFQTLRYVIVPLVKPGIIATGILAFIMSWEEFLYALLFTSSNQAKTISVAIAEFSGKNAVDYGMIAAGGVIASLLPVLIALIFQKYLISGMTAGGVKE
ncbi:carbohydrate ABC transporter permease [Sporolactobacillus terrae]|uniref:carbohydrate ABC transporter permease n=1 Tax=Sporolactobacillus terrae TaxID=269673 RepID=UPI000490C125|nr:carbohydrate ABC transporter permease [Sporolactobacillus terrae]